MRPNAAANRISSQRASQRCWLARSHSQELLGRVETAEDAAAAGTRPGRTSWSSRSPPVGSSQLLLAGAPVISLLLKPPPGGAGRSSSRSPVLPAPQLRTSEAAEAPGPRRAGGTWEHHSMTLRCLSRTKEAHAALVLTNNTHTHFGAETLKPIG